MLECDFCGCYAPRPEPGWLAYARDKHAAVDEPGVLVYRPSCAEAVFNHRSDAAADHVCIWRPQAGETHDASAEVT